MYGFSRNYLYRFTSFSFFCVERRVVRKECLMKNLIVMLLFTSLFAGDLELKETFVVRKAKKEILTVIKIKDNEANKVLYIALPVNNKNIKLFIEDNISK